MKLTPDSKIVSQARLIVEAAEKGGTLQMLNVDGWQDIRSPELYLGHNAYEFRIKPEPKMVYLNFYHEGNWAGPYETVNEATRGAASHAARIAVPFREVTDN